MATTSGYADVNGLHMYYEVCGEGTPLVLLHGGMLSIELNFGGLIPEGGPVSAHLASRLDVENILHDADPCTVALRASIVIGAGSSSFRFLVWMASLPSRARSR